MDTPDRTPPKKNTRIVIIVLAAVVLSGACGAFFLVRAVVNSGITAGPDKMFGDQHLKTAVALIELHKTRYGAYPEKLKDLKFCGDWDRIALNSVAYTVSPDRASYYVEVTRGWVGKPSLTMPAEFWQGTGYNPSLKQQ